MKTVQKFASLILFSLIPACGQQLVEFGLVGEPSDQSVAERDSAVVPDFASFPDLFLDAMPDSARPFDLPMDAMPDAARPLDLVMLDSSSDGMPDASLQPPGPLAACAAKIGAAASTFAVLGGVTVTNVGANTMISGNVGVSPGNAIVGIPMGQPTNGSIHLADPLAAQAQMDVTSVYTCSQAAVCDKNLTGTDLGGMTLAQGVYCFNSSAGITGNLVLDAKGDPNAIWFIQIMSTLDLANNAQVKVIGGGNNCNVFWQVGSSVTMGTNSVLVGNLLALASITLKTGASVSGRALARNGATTMDTNAVVKCN